MNRIVLVDEDPASLRLYAEALPSPEFEVLTYEDSREALAAVRERTPDLIVCDLRMPHMDGHEFLKSLKAAAALRDVPFLFLSGFDSKEEVLAALEHGADDFLSKPYDPPRLRAKVRATLRLSDRSGAQDRRPREGLSGLLGEAGTPLLVKYCERVGLTGRLTVESAGSRVWGDFVKGHLTRAGQEPEDPEQDATDVLLSLRAGTYYIEQAGLDAGALEDAEAQAEAETESESESETESESEVSEAPAKVVLAKAEAEPQVHIPMGRLGVVEARGKEFQVQTEGENRPNFTVTTVVVTSGQVVRKFESAWTHPLHRAEDEASARAQIDRQHERVVTLLRERGAGGSRSRVALASTLAETPSVSPPGSAEKDLVTTELGAPAPRLEASSDEKQDLAAGAGVSLAGRLSHFNLGEVLSVLGAARAEGRLELHTPSGEAVVGFKAGNVVHASTGRLEGELAALTVMAWDSGQFAFWPEPIPGERHPIQRSSQALCLEAMRLRDSSQDEHLVFSPAGWADERLWELSGMGRQVLGNLDMPSGIGRVARRCDLSRLEALYHLERLVQRGAVRQKRVDEDERVPGDQVRVLLVEDSRLMQKALKRLYESEGDMTVAGVASNGVEALELLPKLRPDLVCLDLYMPVMDGLIAAERIMATRPTPIVVVTSAGAGELELVLKAILDHGVVDFITKPAAVRGSIETQGQHILARLRKAARVNLRGLHWNRGLHSVVTERSRPGRCQGAVVVAAGTGSCSSYLQLLAGMPADLPFAVAGNLNFPPDFLAAFVAYLQSRATFQVEVAADGMALQGGVCYLATHDVALTFTREADGQVLNVRPGAGESAPADLFRSAAEVFGKQSVGLLLSGEGAGIAPGLEAIRQAGGVTLAQTPESCMDPEQCELALRAELVDRTVSLPYIANGLSSLLARRRKPPPG